MPLFTPHVHASRAHSLGPGGIVEDGELSCGGGDMIGAGGGIGVGSGDGVGAVTIGTDPLPLSFSCTSRIISLNGNLGPGQLARVMGLISKCPIIFDRAMGIFTL